MSRGVKTRSFFALTKFFGWDAHQQVYTFHFFDSDGANPPHRAEGTWVDDQLRFEQQTPFGRVRHTFTFSGQATFTYRMETSEDGQAWAVFWEGRYRRL